MKEQLKEILESLIEKFCNWIGTEELIWLSEFEDLISIHFREGMQIRNWMHNQEECKDWTCHELDDNWMSLVEKTIKKYL